MIRTAIRLVRAAGRVALAAALCAPFCPPAAAASAAAVGTPPTPPPASAPAEPAGGPSSLLTPAAPAKEGPRIVLPEPAQTRDSVPDGSAVEFLFPIRNDGKSPLHLVEVMPSCACTVPSYNRTILPGQTESIKAVLSVAPWTEGDLTRTLTVFSDDFAHSPQMLTLTAHVVPTVDVLPASAVTVPYDKPAPIVRTFTLRLHRGGVLHLSGALALSGPVTARMETDPSQAGAYRVTITLRPPPSGGDALGEVDVPTGLPGIGAAHLTIQALGEKGITVTPGSLDFGSVQSAGDARQAVIYSRKSVFRIRKVTSSDPAIKMSWSPGPRPGWFSLTALYTGGWKPGAHRGAVTIVTDLAGTPPLQVPFTANVPSAAPSPSNVP